MQTEPASDIARKSKYFISIAIMFVTVLMISNTVASKIVQIGPFSFAGAIFIFPISYIFGDILTEVYGYKATRKIVWSGFASLVLMALTYWFVQILPGAPFWKNQSAYDLILGGVPRIVLGSIVAYFVGEFSNSFVMSKMKIWSNGKHLWMRTIGSTVVGQLADSGVFIFLAFYGTVPPDALVTMAGSQWLMKSAYETLVTPLTYLTVNFLKRAEREDFYDRKTNFNPLRWRD
jgi:conserved hypothetical integral membrane protein